jgi:hypothetical protein
MMASKAEDPHYLSATLELVATYIAALGVIDFVNTTNLGRDDDCDRKENPSDVVPRPAAS